MLKRRKRPIHRKAFALRGVVYAEFLIAFLPIFVFFLGMVQLALVYGCKLAVQRAANNAARAAVVVLDDDPRWYDCQPRMSFPSDVTCTQETRFAKLMDKVMSHVGGGDAAEGGVQILNDLGLGGDEPEPEPVTRGCRFRAIREAAVMSMIPFAPTINQFTEHESIAQAMGLRAACFRSIQRCNGWRRRSFGVAWCRSPFRMRRTAAQ